MSKEPLMASLPGQTKSGNASEAVQWGSGYDFYENDPLDQMLAKAAEIISLAFGDDVTLVNRELDDIGTKKLPKTLVCDDAEFFMLLQQAIAIYRACRVKQGIEQIEQIDRKDDPEEREKREKRDRKAIHRWMGILAAGTLGVRQTVVDDNELGVVLHELLHWYGRSSVGANFNEFLTEYLTREAVDHYEQRTGHKIKETKNSYSTLVSFIRKKGDRGLVRIFSNMHFHGALPKQAINSLLGEGAFDMLYYYMELMNWRMDDAPTAEVAAILTGRVSALTKSIRDNQEISAASTTLQKQIKSNKVCNSESNRRSNSR